MNREIPLSLTPEQQAERNRLLAERVEREGSRWQKAVPTRARVLTEKDFKEMGGAVVTLENKKVSFKVGDLLAIGVAGEQWPISTESASDMKRLGEPDAQGFADYQSPPVWALQMGEDFFTFRERGDRLDGRAGDYLVWNGKRLRPIQKEIFEKSYQPLNQSTNENG